MGFARVRRKDAQLHLLIKPGEETLNAIVDGYEEIDCVIDSGAAESVAPPSLGRGYAIKGSEGSRRGQSYLTADGNRLEDKGFQPRPAKATAST